MRSDEIMYQLILEDVQDVALQELNRKLTKIEIKQIKNCIAKNIDWYNIIVDSIEKNLGDEFYRSN